MSLRESLRIAAQGLLANRLRSGLTMLGVMIGVGAVIVLVAVGNGSALAVQQRIQSLGTNTLIVSRGFGFAGGGGGGGFAGGGAGGRGRIGTQSQQATLTLADVKALQNPTNAPDIKKVAPVVNAQSVTGSYQASTYSPASFVGTTPDYAEIRNYGVAAGAFFTTQDVTDHRRVVVLGQTVVANLFGTQNPIGNNVKFGNATFNVIGVLNAKGTNGTQDQDDVVLAPYSAVQDTLTGNSANLSSIAVEAISQGASNNAAAEITAVITADHKLTAAQAGGIQVLNQSQLLQTSSDTNSVFTTLLGAVAAISLLVGGIGVMNIMLVNVTERTREIGIRKALGAQRASILGQFLIEAVLLTTVGGILGVAGGIVGSQFQIVGIDPVIAPYSVFLAFGVAVVVGLFFGIYPANRAAALRPIEALRHE
jgi:putative ABC transport system permease protein